jgi:hypothetical protein
MNISPLLALAVVVLSATAVHAVPTTYQYTGNPFTIVSGPYTTSDFVTAMVTLAAPLGANMPLTIVTPTAFTLNDGVQTISNLNATFASFVFATDASGAITEWSIGVGALNPEIVTTSTNNQIDTDQGFISATEEGHNFNDPGEWRVTSDVPDAGSTISLMTLTLMALGLVARRFQRAAG